MSTSPTDRYVSAVTGRIQSAMSDSGRSVARMARETGMSRHTLTRRLSGVTPFDTGELYVIAQVLGISIDSLLADANGDAA